MRLPIARLGRFLALTLAVWSLAGCATTRGNSYTMRGVDLRQYHTYMWGPADARPTGDPRLDNNRFLEERVRMQVEKQLASRGFFKAGSEAPDVLVHYHVNVTQEIDAGTLDRDAEYRATPAAGRRSTTKARCLSILSTRAPAAWSGAAGSKAPSIG